MLSYFFEGYNKKQLTILILFEKYNAIEYKQFKKQFREGYLTA